MYAVMPPLQVGETINFRFHTAGTKQIVSSLKGNTSKKYYKLWKCYAIMFSGAIVRLQ